MIKVVDFQNNVCYHFFVRLNKGDLKMKQTKKEMTIEFYQSQPDSNTENNDGQIIVSYTSIYNKLPTVVIWNARMRGHKPTYHYSFKTVEERQTFIDSQKAIHARDNAACKARFAEAAKESEKIQVGSIFYESWGWEQTNINFYEVVERKGMFVKIQEIGSDVVSGSHAAMSGTKMPNRSVRIGEVMRKKINPKFANVKIREFGYSSLWDGKPKSFTCYA